MTRVSGEEPAEHLLRAVPCAAFQLDGDHRIAYANPALGLMVGREASALQGQPVELLFSPAAGAMFQSYVLPVLALRGHIEEFVLSVRGEGGRPLDVLMYARTDGQADRPGMLAILAPYQTRQTVDEELLKVKRAADQSPAMIFELVRSPDARLRFTYVSHSSKLLYGCLPQQVRADAGKILDQFPVDVLEQLAAPGQAGERPLHAEMRVREGQPDAAWHELNAVARPTVDGSVIWAGSVADVSLRRALQAEAVELRAAEQARRSQLEFLGRLSHELRTPLNAVLGFTQLLAQSAEEGGTPLNRRYIELIGSAGQRLLGLVDDVLDLSRLRAAQFAVQPAPVRLAGLAKDAAALFGPQAARASVTLSVDVPEDLWVLADAARLTQVIDNLLSNAVKYNRPGGRVALRAAATDAVVQIEVVDTGTGLDEAQCRALFQPFNRLGAERRGIAGTGLGLVIALQIVQAMQGTLGVHSEPGRGTCFTVRLPRAAGSGAAPSG